MILSGIGDESADALADQCRMHRELGWNYIDVRNVDGQVIDRLSDEAFDEVAATLADQGVKASCLASDVGKLCLDSDEYRPFAEDVASLERLLARAQRLGCGYIRVMAYRKEDLSDAEWRAEGVARLKELAALAEGTGVALGLENCVGWHAHGGARMCDFLDAVGSDSLVCLYDIGSPPVHDADPVEFYDAVKDRIAYIHVKDDAGNADWTFTYPGEGICNVRAVLEDQYARGYRGFLAIEPHMAASAHMPDKGNGLEPAVVYRKYGEMMNTMLAEITGGA